MISSRSSSRTRKISIKQLHVVLLLLLGFPFILVGQEDVGRQYEDALRSSQQGKFEEAVIHLKNALQASPDHLPSRLLMAEVLIRQGNGAVAETELEYAQAHGVSANQLLPHFAEAYLLQDKYRLVLDITKPSSRGKQLESKLAFFRGQAHLGLNQLSSAYQEFDRAVQLRPGFKEASLGKAQVLIKRDQVDQASLIIDELLKNRFASANTWLVQANIQRLKKDYSGALTSLNRAITVDRNHLAARLARAGLQMVLGKLDQAEQDIDFILSKIPLEPRAKYLKAIISVSKGDGRSASEKIGEVMTTLKGVPDGVMMRNPSYLYLAGKTSFKLGIYDSAKAFLNRYLKIVPNDLDSMRTLAVIELRMERPGVARAILAKLNVVYPDHPGVLSLLGSAYMGLKKYDQAQRYFEKVLSLSPESVDGLSNLASSKMAKGEYSAAIEDLLKAKALSGTHQLVGVNALLGSAYTSSKQYKEALQIYLELIEISPENSRFPQLYGVVLGLSGDLEGAQKWLQRALELDPINTEAIVHLARMDIVKGDSEKAIGYLKTKIDENPENHLLMVELGNIYFGLRDSKSALFWFNKAYANNNNSHLTLDGLIDVLTVSGSPEDAVEILNEYIGRNPSDAKAHGMLGKVLGILNKPRQAVEAYKVAANFASDKSQPLMMLSKAQLAVGDREGAKNSLKKAIAWDESSLAGHIALAKLAMKSDDKDYVLKLISSISRISPDTPVAHVLKGEYYHQLNEHDEAESNFQKALEMGDSLKALSGLYAVYRDQNRIADIVPRLEIWLKKHPNDMQVNMLLADSFLRSGRLQDSKGVYQKLLKIYPNSPVILNNAAEAYFGAGDELVAVRFANQAVDAAPKNAEFLDTLGWIESRMGNMDKALALFREALAYDFTNPNVKYHLALTLDKVGRRGEAGKLLSEIVDDDRPFAEMEEAQSLLVEWSGQ